VRRESRNEWCLISDRCIHKSTIFILRSLVVMGRGWTWSCPVMLSWPTGSVQDRTKVVPVDRMSLGGVFVHLPKTACCRRGVSRIGLMDDHRRERSPCMECWTVLRMRSTFSRTFGSSRLLDYSKAKWMIGEDCSYLSGR
jgi:hypothetical protein